MSIKFNQQRYQIKDIYYNRCDGGGLYLEVTLSGVEALLPVNYCLCSSNVPRIHALLHNTSSSFVYKFLASRPIATDNLHTILSPT
jgi:hypothetical protein